MAENSNNGRTRHRLLESACCVFAEKGFHKATIAEICQRAEANLASVNYHFGSKRGLYERAWRHAFALTSEAFPLDGGLARGATGEERLRAFILAFLHRLLDEGPCGYFSRIMSREMTEPTSSFAAIYAEVMLPTRRYIRGVLEELAGAGAGEEELFRCTYSVVSQCLFLRHHLPMRERMLGTEADIGEEINALGEYLTRFCLGGIAAVRKS